jgi:N-acyl-phosphatidylethanolamine-hydrolysing phospholipase D
MSRITVIIIVTCTFVDRENFRRDPGLEWATDRRSVGRHCCISSFLYYQYEPPGLPIEELPHIDVVVLSHNHYDHLDRDSIVALSRQAGGAPLFLTPLGLKDWLRAFEITNAVELDWWQHHRHNGVEFHCTPAQHWSGRGLHDRNRTLWCAWAVLSAAFALVVGFTLGWWMLDRSIRKKYGGLKIY